MNEDGKPEAKKAVAGPKKRPNSLLEEVMEGRTSGRADRPSRKRSDAQMQPMRRLRSNVPLQEERYKRNVTQARLAVAVSTPELPVTGETIRLLEKGAAVDQGDEILRRIARRLGLPEDRASGLVTPYHVHGRSYPKHRPGLLEEIRERVAKLTPEELQEQLAKLQADLAAKRAKLEEKQARLEKVAPKEQLKLKLERERR